MQEGAAVDDSAKLHDNYVCLVDSIEMAVLIAFFNGLIITTSHKVLMQLKGRAFK